MKKELWGVIITLAVFVGIGFIIPVGSLAEYPERSVTLICPWPSGGSMDIQSRAITEAAKKYFPKPIVVVNRPGAAGTIGAAEMIQAKPDGYTIGLSASAALVLLPHLTKLPYGLPDDYTPIMKLTNMPIVFAIRSNSPWKTLSDVIEYARANPGNIRVGITALKNFQHLDMEKLKAFAKIDLRVVPLDAPMNGLLGEHIEATHQPAAEVLPHFKAGSARILAIADEKRNSLFPEIPTYKELGYDIPPSVYSTVMGPKGLPPQVVSKLHDTFKKAMQDPIFIKAVAPMILEPSYEGQDQIRKRLIKDYEQNANSIKYFESKEK